MYQHTSTKSDAYRYDLYSAIKPLYYMSKLMGLAPFIYIQGTCAKITLIKSSWLGNIYSFSLMLLIIACKAGTLIGRIYYIYPKLVMTLTVTDFMIWVSSGICMLASFIVATTFGQMKLFRILKMISYIDEILLADVSNNYRKISLFLKAQLILLYSIVGGICIYDYYVKTSQVGNRLLFYIPMIYLNFLVMYTIIAQFVNLILLIWHRYKVLNSYLFSKYKFGKITKTCQVNASHISLHNGRKAMKNKSQLDLEIEKHPSHVLTFTQLHTLRILHNLLYDCSELVSSMYGFQIMLEMVNSVIRTTTSLYYSVTFAVQAFSYNGSEDITKQKHIFVLNTCWIPILFMKMTSVSLTCHLASSEANQTAILLQKLLLIDNIDQNVKVEIQEFIQQVHNQKLGFKACGFFKIDLSMLRALVVAVFTYLLILIQFYIPK